jgi:hypothetical protein
VHAVYNLQKGAPVAKDIQMALKVSKQHGCLEQAMILTCTQLNGYLEWPYVAQVFRIERIGYHPRRKGKSREVVYWLTILSAASVCRWIFAG